MTAQEKPTCSSCHFWWPAKLEDQTGRCDKLSSRFTPQGALLDIGAYIGTDDTNLLAAAEHLHTHRNFGCVHYEED